jgi:hypothetical protein
VFVRIFKGNDNKICINRLIEEEEEEEEEEEAAKNKLTAAVLFSSARSDPRDY